jgi:hypothetical protein
VRADARAPALLALTPSALVSTDVRPSTLASRWPPTPEPSLCLYVLPSALVRADARAPALYMYVRPSTLASRLPPTPEPSLCLHVLLLRW